MENKKIIDYIIISDRHTERLRIEILKKLQEGYVLVGGISFGGPYEYFAQAMIKYEE